jgi:hypothetical protein
MTLDTLLRDQLAYAREVEPSDTELAAAKRAARAAPARRRLRRIQRPAAIAVAVALLVPAAAVAASSVGDALTSFLGLAESAPITLDGGPGTVIDERDGVAFTVTRNDDQDVCLELGGSVGICGSTRDEDWGQQLADRAVAPVGTIPPRDRARSGPVPLFVLTAPAAEQVEVTYRAGAPTVRDVGQGGAVIAVDSDRGPQEVIARDRTGAELGRSDIGGQQWTWCYDEAGCS